MPRPKGHPIQQHYLPRIYLAGFGDDRGFVGQYDLAENKHIPPQDPRKVAKRRDFYDAISTKGTWTTVEDILALIESRFADQIGELIKHVDEALESAPDPWVLPHDVRQGLTYFIAAQTVRVPCVRDAKMADLEQLCDGIHSHFVAQDAFVERIHKQMQRDGHDWSLERTRASLEGCRLKPAETEWLVLVMDGIDRIYDDFILHAWQVLVASEEKRFITSDRPVHYWDADQNVVPTLTVGFLGRGLSKVVPLTDRIALRLHWLPEAFERQRTYTPVTLSRLDDASVCRLNADQAYYCDRRLFGDPELIREALETAQPDPEDRPGLVAADDMLVETELAKARAEIDWMVGEDERMETPLGRRRPRRRQRRRRAP